MKNCNIVISPNHGQYSHQLKGNFVIFDDTVCICKLGRGIYSVFLIFEFLALAADILMDHSGNTLKNPMWETKKVSMIITGPLTVQSGFL